MLRLAPALICISSFLFTTIVDAGLAKALQGTYDRLKARDEKMASEWVNTHIRHRDAPERRQSGDPVVDFATAACNTYVAVEDYSTCYGALYAGLASSETAYCDKKYAELEQCVSTQNVSQCASSQTSYDQCQNYTLEAYDYCIEDPGRQGVTQLIDCADNSLEVNPPAISVSSLPPPPPSSAMGFAATFSIAIPPVTSTVPPAVVSIGASTDGTCGGVVGYFCQGTVYGDCCSGGGYCGNMTLFCGAGCQADYGHCWTSVSSSSIAVATLPPVQGPFQAGPLHGPLSGAGSPASSSSSSAPLPQPTSPDGTCGGANGYTCYGTSFGYCCSSQGYCGDNTLGPGYCGTGCQTAFGLCDSDFTGFGSSSPIQSTLQTTSASVSPSSAPSSAPTDILSIILGQTQTCGPSYARCPNGQCCGSSGQCGTDLSYCGPDCQFDYGTCWVPEPSGSRSVYVPAAATAPSAATTSACTPGMRKRRVRIG